MQRKNTTKQKQEGEVGGERGEVSQLTASRPRPSGGWLLLPTVFTKKDAEGHCHFPSLLSGLCDPALWTNRNDLRARPGPR